MTDLSALSPRELDAAVARELGWTEIEHIGFACVGVPPGRRMRGRRPAIPFYSAADLSGTGPVLGELHKRGKFHVGTLSRGRSEVILSTPDKVIQAIADDLARALCEALVFSGKGAGNDLQRPAAANKEE